MNDKQKAHALEGYTVTFEIKNSTSKKMRLWIEPWTYEYWIDPTEAITIVARGPKAGYPTLIYEDNTVVFMAWPQSVFSIYRDDELISHSLEDCLPEPSGISWSQAERNLIYREGQ